MALKDLLKMFVFVNNVWKMRIYKKLPNGRVLGFTREELKKK